MKRFAFALVLAIGLLLAGPAAADPITATAIAITTALPFISAAVDTVVFYVTYAALSLGIGMAFNAVLSAFITPAASTAQQRQASVTSLSVGETPRQMVIGRAGVGGSLLWAFNYGGTDNTDWEVQIIRVADHLCDALEGYWLNDTFYSFDTSGVQPGFNGQLQIWWQPGNVGDLLPDVVLENTDYTPDDTGDGVARIIFGYKIDAPDAKTPVWSGRPTFLPVVRGLRLYDPRQDDTAGGEGPQRWADISTHTWADNAALAHYYYLRGVFACGRQDDPEQLLVGRGLSAVEAPPERVIAFANICDETVTNPDGSTEPRYRVGGVIMANQTYADVEQMFADAMAGTIIQPDGGVDVEPGYAKTPVATFGDADLVTGEKEQFSGQRSIADRVNTVVPNYPEPTQKWASTGASIQRDADSVAEIGSKELPVSYDLVPFRTQVERNAAIRLRLERLEKTATVVLGPRFVRLQEGDWITRTSSKARRAGNYVVTARGRDAQWRMTCALQEVTAEAYGFDAEGVAIPVPPAPITRDALAFVDVQAVAITISGAAGEAQPAVRFSWDTPALAAISGLRAEIRLLDQPATVAVTLSPAVSDGTLTVTNGVGANVLIEARLVPVAPGRVIAPSDWIPLSTGESVTSQAAALGERTAVQVNADLNDAIAQGLALLGQVVDAISDLDAAGNAVVQGAMNHAALVGFVDQQTHIDGDTLVAIISVQGVMKPDKSAFIIDDSVTEFQSDGSTIASRFAQIMAALGTNAADITTEETARADADTALAELITALTATVGDNTAALTTEASTRADEDTALASLIASLTATVGDNTAALATEASTRADADGAEATLREALATTVDGHTSSISLIFDTLDGNQATAVLAVSVDNVVTGFQINGALQQFAIEASTVAIVDPSSGTLATPFLYTDDKFYLTDVYVQLLKADVVETQHLVSDAVTTHGGDVDGTTYAIGNDPSSQTVVYTEDVELEDPDTIDIDFCTLCENATLDDAIINLDIYFGSTLLTHTANRIGGDGQESFSGFGDAKKPGAGTYTIQIRADSSKATGTNALSTRLKWTRFQR